MMACTNADAYRSGQDAERCSRRTSGADEMTRRVAPHAKWAETLYSSALSHNAMSLITSERWPVPRSIDAWALVWCTRCTVAAATQIQSSLAQPHSAACVEEVVLFQRQRPGRFVPCHAGHRGMLRRQGSLREVPDQHLPRNVAFDMG
jgi:hypothetical protein